jgi:hypothetical protein
VRARPCPFFIAAVTAVALVARPAMADPPLATPARLPAPPPPTDDTRLRFTGGIALGGVGALFVVLGSVLGVRAIVDKGQIGTHCNGAGLCDLVGYTLGTEAQHFAALSSIGFAAGLPALAAGLVMAVPVAPKKRAGLAWLTPTGVRW